MSHRIRIFLSAATADLEQYRISLRDRLIRGNIDAVEQQHFGLTDTSLVEKLFEKIKPCDYVICLIGHKSGHVASKPALDLIKNYACFTEESGLLSQYEAATNAATISYTQLEFFIAKALQKTTYLFKLPNESDNDEFGTLSEDTSQQLYRQWLYDANFDYVRFSNEVELENEVQTVLLDTLNPTQRIVNLPYQPLGALFLGRDEFLVDLHKELTSDNPTTVIGAKTQPTTVHGSGGIGKTRVAIEYAWHYSDHYSALLFVTAESAQQLDSNLAELSSILPLDIDDIEAQSDEVRCGYVIGWLKEHSNWLLIIDNVDEPTAADQLQRYLPDFISGKVLITSRLSKWGAGITRLELDLLTQEAAVQYLLNATDADRLKSDEDTLTALEIATQTGRLALGLEHAAAYINVNEISLAEYASHWKSNEAQILEAYDSSLVGYDQNRPVETRRETLVTWKLSVDQLDDDARLLLDILSWLSPEPLPISFLDAVPDELFKGDLQQAVNALVRYSLISRLHLNEQQWLQVHRLVQSTTRYHQENTPSEQEVALPGLEGALNWIDKAFQGNGQDVRDWPVLEPLVDHVLAVCEYGDSHGKTEQSHPTARLLNDAAQLFTAKASYNEAEPLMRRALEIDESSYGESHPNVARDLNNLALLLEATNRLEEAEPLMRRALEIDESSYGVSHPLVAIRLNNLAQLLKATNRLEEAEPLMRRALVIAIQFGLKTGHEHPNLKSREANYIHILEALGKSEDEIRERLEVVAIQAHD